MSAQCPLAVRVQTCSALLLLRGRGRPTEDATGRTGLSNADFDSLTGDFSLELSKDREHSRPWLGPKEW